MRTITGQIGTSQQVQFASALNFLLAQKGGLDTKALAEKADLSQRSVNYARGGGKRSGVSMRSAEKIAAVFGLTYAQILTLGERILSGEDGGAALAEIRRGRGPMVYLGGKDREAGRALHSVAYSPPAVANVEPAPLPVRDRQVPIISFVQAGNWATAVDNFQPDDAEDWVHCSPRCGPRSFGLRVKGPSMEPEFREGEIIIVDPDIRAESGDFVVAKNGDEEATFKRYLYEGGRHYLVPLNNKFDPMDMTGKDWRIVGRVLEKTKNY